MAVREFPELNRENSPHIAQAMRGIGSSTASRATSCVMYNPCFRMDGRTFDVTHLRNSRAIGLLERITSAYRPDSEITVVFCGPPKGVQKSHTLFARIQRPNCASKMRDAHGNTHILRREPRLPVDLYDAKVHVGVPPTRQECLATPWRLVGPMGGGIWRAWRGTPCHAFSGEKRDCYSCQGRRPLVPDQSDSGRATPIVA